MTTSADITLSSLLPSPYLFVYAIPLLISSLLLTFAGAFLTLDRTFTFAPQAPIDFAMKSKSNRWWALGGGVGGLAGGWAFGAHLSAFLSLIIMNRTADPPLTPVYFLVIHLASSILFTVLAGRFKIAALTCTGISGGVGLALMVSVALHPSLLTRLVFVAILGPLVLIATLLPVAPTQHAAVRLAASSVGAFSTIVAIALLAHIPAWANVWERLWLELSPHNDWGSAAERGLSAAAFIILACGTACDWFLRRQFGENPDQKWDSYLAHYASNLPDAADRAGTFQPFRSFWQRLFHLNPPNPLIFPPDIDLKTRSPPALSGGFQKRPDKSKLFRKRSAVKFQPLGGYSDSDSDDKDSEPEWDAKGAPYTAPDKPWVKKNVSSSGALSGATVYSSDDEAVDKSKEQKKPTSVGVVYSSDSDADVKTPSPLARQKSRGSQKSHRDEPGWKPDFLKRHTSHSPTNASSVTAVSPTPALPGVVPVSPTPAPPGAVPTSTTPAPPGAVPMTPSLIRAIDRIAVAQNEVYGQSSTPPLSPPPGPKAKSGDKWLGFWERVQHKAAGT